MLLLLRAASRCFAAVSPLLRSCFTDASPLLPRYFTNYVASTSALSLRRHYFSATSRYLTSYFAATSRHFSSTSPLLRHYLTTTSPPLHRNLLVESVVLRLLLLSTTQDMLQASPNGPQPTRLSANQGRDAKAVRHRLESGSAID